MEKNRSEKIIAIIALFIAVVGLSIGFAAYSRTLNITFASGDASSVGGSAVDSEGNVDGVWEIKFSTSEESVQTGTVNGIPTGADVTAMPATLTIDGISGLGGNLKKTGDYITYTFYAHNTAKVDAYLREITFAAANGESKTVKCTANTGTNQNLVDNVCDSFKVTVTVGSETGITATKNDFRNHVLGSGQHEKITVKVEYGSTENVTDGDFKVEFGQINLKYSSIDNA